MIANQKLKPIVFRAGALLTFCSCLGLGDSQPAQASWQKIEDGMEVTAHHIEGPPYETKIKFIGLRVNLEKFQVKVMDSRALGAIRMEIKSLVRKSQALAGINGGFFTPEYKPLGLLIIDGQQVNPLRKTDWGVFMVQSNRPRLVHTREFQNDRSVSQALQVGPRLVVEGRELRLKRQIARRSALGINWKDEVILLNTEETEVYAQDLARIFRLPEAEGGLECREALALDGGPSAQMYGDYKNLKIDISGGWGVPNGIGVFKR
jgi:uncharacterized protein YigE (DUF2233 family)